MQKQPAPGTPLSEYIDDRALSGRKQDRLHHGGLADELAALVTTQPTPLHVAVYGPWGSGKSSLARLLEEAIQGINAAAWFVRVDAWKYVQDSFRRQFILEAAEQLGLSREKYRQRLYEKRKRSRVEIPVSSLLQLGKAFSFFAGVALALSLLAGSIFVLVTDADNFRQALTGFMKATIGPAFVSASFFAALFAFMGKLFVTDVEESEVSSEERFEEVFCDLIAEARSSLGCERLVFYIDELDRCSSGNVVSVLESIRTFLDVEHCVFLVSADNRVLELAVQQEMPHPVPDEESNPYYSSGAEYLDKLFQHQLSIPPLQPQRLTTFALGLVDYAPGVWSEVKESGLLGTLITVVIPSHVTSPRRVKVLLNGFVSAFKTGVARHKEDERTTPDARARVLELAKLATLRLEFPLFYRDLIAFPTLADDLTAYLLADNTWSASGERDATRNGTHDLVLQYAERERSSAAMLSKSADTDQALDPQAPGEEVDGSTGADGMRRSELLSYLRKTAEIRGPGRDMVFLESGGSMFGLPEKLAETLERAAIDNDKTALAGQFADLTPDERVNAVRLLHELRRSLFGVEASNVLAATLDLLQVGLVDAATVADGLLTDVIQEMRSTALPLELLPAASSVAANSSRPDADEALRAVLTDQRLRSHESADIARRVLKPIHLSDKPLFSEVSDLIVALPAGFLADADDAFSGDDFQGLMQHTTLLRELSTRWKGADDDDAREDDLSDFSALLSGLDGSADTQWDMLSEAMNAGRPDLVQAWYDRTALDATTASHSAALVASALELPRERWSEIGRRTSDAPRTSSVQLYNGVLALLEDAQDNDTDAVANELLDVLARVWGEPRWPNNWSEVPMAGEPAWGLDSVRLRRHELTRRLRSIDSTNQAMWGAALVKDYEGFLAQGDSLSSHAVALVFEQLVEDWPSDIDTGLRLTEALEESVFPDDVVRLVTARIATRYGTVVFPIDDVAEAVLLLDGTDSEQELVSLWLSDAADPDSVLATAREMSPEQVVRYGGQLLGAAKRSKEVARDLASALEPMWDELPDDILGRILQLEVPEGLSVRLGERLRVASNEPERRAALRIWRLWAPIDPSVRRPLVDAFINMAGGGRRSFELACASLDLVDSPPKGTKSRLVQTLLNRAEAYGTKKKVERLLVGRRLAKPRRGLLGIPRGVETEDDTQEIV